MIIHGFTGDVIAPGDDRYDRARRVWNAAIDRYPALIARARGTADVVAVVRYAHEHGLPLSVRGGGHSAAGLAVADGALMLDLSGMKAVTVDPASRTAVAAPGLTWEELDAAEVVTADGRVLQASSAEHPDLLWALRGGGGNFGVVTSFTYRLHPVTGAYGRLLGYPFDRAAEVLHGYADFSGQAPDQLALYAALTTAPPLPFIPRHLHGQRLAALLAFHFGEPEDAERAVASVRALLPPPAADATGPISYPRIQQMAEGPAVPGMHHYYTAEWLDALDDAAIDALVSAAGQATSPRSMIVVKRMGGATARVPADGTAFWYRQAAHNLDIHAQWQPGNDPAAHVAWAHAARQAARHVSAGGGYVNFVGADQGQDRIRAAYGGNYDRLAEVKAAYDPDNFFRINHNIVPAGTEAHTCHRSGPPGAGS